MMVFEFPCNAGETSLIKCVDRKLDAGVVQRQNVSFPNGTSGKTSRNPRKTLKTS
jgi:hypothetical protein